MISQLGQRQYLKFRHMDERNLKVNSYYCEIFELAKTMMGHWQITQKPH